MRAERNIKLTVSYDGTNFHGFQRQPKLRTVQGELEKTLSKLTGESISITGSGRTDAGVHGWGQVVNFQTSSQIPEEKWTIAVNTLLPKDLVIRSVSEVSAEFHARYDATGKHYRYQIDNSRNPDVFRRRYTYHVPQSLDIGSMIEASQFLIGEHDFTSFCSVATKVGNKVRTIYQIDVQESNGILDINCMGSGFLYNMVRIIVGTLVDVGKGRIAVSSMNKILAAKDRVTAGLTAPAHGLTLMQVYYQNEFEKN